MSTDDKYDMNESLSDILAKAKEKEGLDIVRLRDEIRKEIEAGDKTLVKFLELVESFQDVLPKEKQRYNVAIRALSTTSGLSRQNVLESTDNQLEELKRLQKGVLTGLPDFRDELTAMESRSQEIKSEIAKLHETIAQLEKEEQELLGSKATREREMETIEEAVSKLFTDIGAEISGIRKKVEEYTAEKAPPQRTAPPVFVETRNHGEEQGDTEEEKGVTGEEGKIEEPIATQDKEWLKKCPMCGGQMNFHLQEKMWMCYSCGHDEPPHP